MSYEVRCECGKAHAVSAADAGSSLRCTCGRTVDVPALHVLRASTGERSVSPLIQIQSGFLSGELPGPPKCACCRRDTDRQVTISIVCEQAIGNGPAAAGAAATTALSGCLMFLTGIFIFSWNSE